MLKFGHGVSDTLFGVAGSPTPSRDFADKFFSYSIRRAACFRFARKHSAHRVPVPGFAWR